MSFAALAVTPEITFVYLFRIIGYTLAFLVIGGLGRRWLKERVWWLVIPLIAIAVTEAGMGLSQLARGEPVQGTYANRNHFAGLLEMVLPLALAYAIALLKRRSLTKVCAVLCAAALVLAALLYSLSRMGFVAGLAGLFMIALLEVTRALRGWKRSLVIASIAALFLFIFLFLPPDEMVGRFAGLSADAAPSGEGRGPIWRDTLQLFFAYPVFGCGLGTYEVAFLKYQTSVLDRFFEFAHNDYLQLAAELGLAGFLLLGAMLAPIAAKAFRAAAHARDPDTRYLGLGCAGAFTAIGLHSFADFNLYIPANALLLAWIAGICVSLAPGSEPDGHVRMRRWPMILAGLVLIYAPAWLLFETSFRAEPAAENLFCRFGICDTAGVATAQTLAHAGNVASVPTAELVRLLRRDPNSPDRWCDTGESFMRSGKLTEAEYCFSNALALGPNLPPLLMRVSDAYFGLHQTARALQLRAHVLDETDAYDALIFDWYTEKNIPVSAILAHGLPSSRRVAQAFLRDLMHSDRPADAAAAWDWAAARRYVDDPLAIEYVASLFNQGRYETAARTWARYLGPRRGDYLASDWIFNGDFETEPSGSAFDWRIDPRDDVQAVWDAGVAHTGTHSLRVQFEKQGNVSYAQVTQRAFVIPGPYRFEAYIRSQDLTTDQGVALRIFDRESPARLDVRTEQVTGTHDWKKMEQMISVPAGTKLLEIQVVRQPSLKFDNNMSGSVWIDTVRLTPR